MITLDGTEITADLLWIDEYTWNLVEQQEIIMSDGSIVVQAEAQQTGRPISLIGGDTFGYVTKSVVDIVQGYVDTPFKQMTLVLNNGDSYNVIFTEERFTATTVCDNNNPSNDFLYTISLYLREI